MKVSSLSRGVLEKASQSFAAAAAKGFGIVLGAALPTPKTHLRPQVCPKGARSGLQSPRPEKAGRPFLARKKRPRLFQVRGVECCSRGTTLVQPPVTRTALKASNKAAADNEANRPALLLVQADCSGTSYPQGDPHRFAPTTGSLKGAGPVFFPVAAFDVLHFNEGTAVCQVDFSEGSGIRCTSI